jgi:hypothetical protein
LVEQSIEWKAVVDGDTIEAGSSGTHKIYVTLDKPFGKMEWIELQGFSESGDDQDVAEKRLEYSVRAAQGTGAKHEQESVDAIFGQMKKDGIGYFLPCFWSEEGNHTGVEPKPQLQEYLWLCNVGRAKGQCHNIAASFTLACRILGVRGSFEVGYMYGWPGVDKEPPHEPTKPSPSGKNVLGKYNERCTRQHATGHASEPEAILFVDVRNQPNNFEGVACYNKRALYAIGDAIFDDFADPNDNASSYYASRKDKDFLRSQVTNWEVGAFPLVFGRKGGNAFRCPKPFPWVSPRPFDYVDPSNPKEEVHEVAWFKWEDGRPKK